jgi:ABC-2 type transport system permease protein
MGAPLLRKELFWLRRNWRAVAVVFLLAPALFGVATTSFDRTVPQDVPVAVVPADDAVTEDELQAVAGLARTVSEPRAYDSAEAARTALDRERVYGVLTVGHGLYESGTNVTLSLAVDGGMVTYVDPSLY